MGVKAYPEIRCRLWDLWMGQLKRNERTEQQRSSLWLLAESTQTLASHTSEHCMVGKKGNGEVTEYGSSGSCVRSRVEGCEGLTGSIKSFSECSWAERRQLVGHLEVSGLDACYAVYSQANYLPALSSACTWCSMLLQHPWGVHVQVKQSADTNGQYSPYTEHLSG